MFDLDTLWTCPICRAPHPDPVKYCKRCRCHLLLLNKIRITHWVLSSRGCEDQAKTLHPDITNCEIDQTSTQQSEPLQCFDVDAQGSEKTIWEKLCREHEEPQLHRLPGRKGLVMDPSKA